MAGFFSQLWLLLWKNMLLYIRRPCTLIFEIGFPIFFACIMLLLRTVIERENVDYNTYYNSTDLHQTTDNFSNLEIGYVPDYPVAQVVMNDVATQFQTYLGYSATIRGFGNESALEAHYLDNMDKMKLAVVFVGLADTPNLPTTVSFRIRPATSDSQKWHTKRSYPFFQSNAPRDLDDKDPLYVSSGTASLLSLVGESILRQWNHSSGGSKPELEMFSQRMPYPHYYKDGMTTAIQSQLPLFLMLSFILTVIQTTKSIVMEKERRIREAMKLMGLRPAAHWASWFLTTFCYLAVTLAVYAILFGVEVSSDNGAVLTNTDISLFYVFLLCYAVALITFCFMISVIAHKANVGAAVAGIAFFAFYFPTLVVTYDSVSREGKLALCLLFNMAMSYGGQLLGLYEGTGSGATWDNFTKPPSVDDDFTLLEPMLMLLADSCIHVIITWYIDNVFPGEFGVPRPFYFPFTPSYWRGSKLTDISDTVYDSSQTDEEHFEREPENLKAGIQICNLTKKFGPGKTAVDNLRLKMYDGQITVLLGHNGAGKTTTMSMLTGFIPPSAGTALVNGHDIRKDMEGVRKSLGLCPQHNILWDDLTVEEHLRFFAEVKGGTNVKGEAAAMTNEVGLQFKANAKAGSLSGGQKRKLSVGIALIAGSKVVVLDEPSSGMDPAARRQTWEVLQKHRQGRTILLTTHYMDEADVLGDRIAIMSQGVVRCCGSSLFLKKLFGTGYHLVAVKEDGCKIPVLTDAIKSKIPTAEFEEEVNAEVTYLLPDDQSAAFPDLFRFLDANKSQLRIVGFGTSATTMEEVFLKVGEDVDDDIATLGSPSRRLSKTADGFTNHAMLMEDGKPPANANGNSSSQARDTSDDILAFNQNYVKLTGLRLQWSHFYGMFIKKILLSWRHRVISIVQLLLPVIFTVLALLIDTGGSGDEEVLDLNLSPFGTTNVVYSNGSSPTTVSNDAANAYGATFSSQTMRKVNIQSTYNNMSEYFLTLASSLGTSTFNEEVIIGGLFETPDVGNALLKSTAFFNGQPYHALPISIAAVLNALAQTLYNSNYAIFSAIDPLPKDEDAAAKDTNQDSFLQGFLTGFCISFGMAFLTSSFVYFLVKEREVGAKHLQVVSGVGPGMFWLATFIWDYMNYMLPCLCMLIVFAAFDTSAYVEDDRLGLVLLVLMLYGWAALAFVYLVSFMFKSPATAMVLLIMFNIITGLATTLTVFFLSILNLESEADVLNWLFLIIFPNYSMTKAFMDIYVNYLNLDTCTELFYTLTCPTKPGFCCESYGKCTDTCLVFQTDFAAWERPGIGRNLFFMFLQGLVCMAIVLITELSLFSKLAACCKPNNWDAQSGTKRSHKTADSSAVALTFINGTNVRNEAEDSDVAEERNRLHGQQGRDMTKSDSLVIMDLYKQYGSFTAVDGVTVGVPVQECFGLLGQNGAGKTTTFKMLTGDVSVTSGNAYVKGYNVVSQIKKVQQNMGYCPQFDALLDTMTGRETLRMYGRLRGVPSEHIEHVVDKLIEIMMLEPHKDKQSGFYSGGNKRKLSTAIALVGDPPFVLLDEPSAGVDPAARRQLWNVLSKVRASGRTLVLTSHSMEECDALCTRIAIMVNGTFRCLGSPQHLKNKFGEGYTLVVKMGVLENGGLASHQPVVDIVTTSFRGASVFDDMQGFVHFQVPHHAAHVADVFSLMEQAKRDLHVEDYSVHQTTLEQVFLSFTRRQSPPKDSGISPLERAFCCCCMKMGLYGKKD